MADTIEDILARKNAASQPGQTVEEILAHAKKLTYPFPQPTPESNTGFIRTGPHTLAYGDTASGIESLESPGTVYGNIAKIGANIALPIAGMEMAGAKLVPQAFVKARPVIGMLAKAAARALGAGAGGEAAAGVQGEKPSLTRGLKTARNVVLTEGLVRGGGYVLGRAGGVERTAASLAQDQPKLLTKAPASEYAAAGQEIAGTVKNFPETVEHGAYRKLVETRGKVNGIPYVEALEKKVRPNVDERIARGVEFKTKRLSEDLLGRLDPNTLEIDAVQLDDWIRKNLTEPASRVYAKGAGSAWQERLASMRDQLAPQLYKDIGGGAAELQAATHAKLSKVEAAKKMFPEQTPAAPSIQTPAYLRQVLKDSDVGHQVRTRLAELDATAGTQHLARVENLAMRSSWTAQEKAEVEDILANLPTIRYERVGLVRAGARSAGRKFTRAARPVGRIVAVSSNVQGVSQ